MAILKRSDIPGTRQPGIVGTARFSRSDADLANGLRRGDIAVIDRPDIDRDTAELLVAIGVVAVVNTAQSSTGRFPNLGPQVLADAGIVLVDSVGQGILSRLRSGDRIRIHEGQLFRDDLLVGSGIELDSSQATAGRHEASTGLTTKLDTLSANATDHLRREHAMLLEGARIPKLRTKLKGRTVVVVSNAYGATADFAGLKRFIAERDPVLIGAGGGANIIVAAGYRPHLIVGSMDSLPAQAVAQADEVVVTTSSGQIATPERLEKHGRDLVRFVASGDDTDLALLLADESQADVIIHAGAPPSLGDLLDQDAGIGGASFVVRLRAGSKIVDAKAVPHLTSGHLAWWPVLLLLAAAMLALIVAITTSPTGNEWLSTGWSDLGAAIGRGAEHVASWIKGLIS
jgi:uncharacterized membrane-anchored protein